MNDEKRLETVRKGSLSGIALDFFGQEIKNHQSRLLNSMMVEFRNSSINHDKLVGIGAAYTVLEDIYLSLRRNEKNAGKIEMESLNDAPRE